VVIVGDSIADGRGTTTKGNNRWSDNLAARLNAAKMPVAVLNKGIGGGRILDDGLGPNALARFDRDVLSPNGVRWLIVHEGINDLGTFGGQPGRTDADHEELVRRIIAAYKQIIERAHAHGIKVIGATLTGFAGRTYNPTPRGEADRAAINEWIRTSGQFDAVVDFDKAIRDPVRPLHLLPEYDSGDDLHPSPKGYQAMAEAIPLELFRQSGSR
jgi:lysophospholipase L1-like esterase